MRGLSGGLDFVLPGNPAYGGGAGAGFLQPSQAEQAAQQPFDPAVKVNPMLPKFDEEMAYDEKLTQAYYDVYGQLKSFVEGMAQQGVDVTKPSYGGDNTPYLTFKKFQGDLLRTSAELKARLQAEKGTAGQEAQGMFTVTDPTATTIADRGFSTRPSPRLAAVLQNLGRPPMNEQDARSQEALKQSEIQWYTNAINNEVDPNKKGFLQNELNQITQAYKQSWKPPVDRQPSAAEEGRRAKLAAAESIFRRVTNAKAGVFENPEYEVDEDFNVVVKDKAWTATQLGSGLYTVKGKKVTYPKVVESLYRKDGETYVKFMQPSKLSALGKLAEGAPIGGDIIKDEPLRMSGSDLTRIVVENNKLGVTNADVLAALEEQNLLNQKTRFSEDEKVIDKEKVLNAPDSKKVKDIAAGITEDLNKGRLPKTIELPSGQTAVIKSGFRGYYIEVDGNEEIKRLDAKGVNGWLREMGYFDQFVDKPTTNQPVNQPAEKNPFLD